MFVSDQEDKYSDDFVDDEGINIDPNVALRSNVETVFMLGMSKFCALFLKAFNFSDFIIC